MQRQIAAARDVALLVFERQADIEQFDLRVRVLHEGLQFLELDVVDHRVLEQVLEVFLTETHERAIADHRDRRVPRGVTMSASSPKTSPGPISASGTSFT